MSDWEFEEVAGPYGCTTEGPAWDGRYLYFVAIQRSLVMRFDPETGETIEWATNTALTNGTMFDTSGRLFGCSIGDRAIVRFNDDGTRSIVADGLDGKRFNTPNDLAIGRNGRIWFSNPWNKLVALPEQKQEMMDESVILLDPRPDGTYAVSRATSDTTSPNGVLLSADQNTMYVSQCDYGLDAVRELRAYEIMPDGSFGRYTVLHTFGKDYRGVHRPIDGMCLDAEGNIVATAGWADSGPGPMIYIFSPTGRVLETHPLPAVNQPTNCTFGDKDLQTLYITTAMKAGPQGGKLLRVRTNRKGYNLFP